MKKIFCLFLSILTFTVVVSAGCKSTPPEAEYLDLTYQNGVVTVDGDQNVNSYNFYVNDKLLVNSQTNQIDVARAVIDNRPIPFGKWKVTVDGLNVQGQTIIKTKKSLAFDIKELNQENIYTVLKGEYNSTDYFLVSEDIYIYAKGPSNDGSINDYKTISFSADDRVAETNGNLNALFLFGKPFTATLDGDGYSLNFIIDQHINWLGSQLPFVFGGIFGTIESGALVKNWQVFTDSVYEVRSRLYASASFVYSLYGKVENLFVSQINRPMVRPTTNDLYGHETDNYLDKTDNCLAIFSHVYNGAEIKNCVFNNAIYNLSGEQVAGGGVVARCQREVSFNSCAFISAVGNARFFTQTMDHNFRESTVDDYVENASNIYFYSSISNFFSGVGKKVSGQLLWSPTYEDFSGNPLADFGDGWAEEDGDIFLLDKQIYIYD